MRVLSILVNLFLFYSTIKRLNRGVRLSYLTVLVFQLLFFTPVLLELFFGVQDFSSRAVGFDEALNDFTTNILYSIFTIIVPLHLYLRTDISGRKNTSKFLDVRFFFMRTKTNLGWYSLGAFLMFLPFFLIFLSPSPEKYLTEYAYFQGQRGFAISDLELQFHRGIMQYGQLISLISIIFMAVFGKETKANKILLYAAIAITSILNGKRTLFALLVAAMLMIGFFKKRNIRLAFRNLFLGMLVVFFVFIWYAFYTGKISNLISFSDMLRLYFFRDVDVKFSIYALLNPEEYSILEYWGQSYLYNLLLFIPRVLWSNKPYPYDIYVTAAALKAPILHTSWNFQTSLFGEALSNLGWLGILFSMIVLEKFIVLSEKTEKPLVILLCMFIILCSFVNHFGSYFYFIYLWIFLIFFYKFVKPFLFHASKRRKVS